MPVFYSGASEIATLSNTFSITTGGVTTPTDPTTVSLTVTDPSGTASTYTWAGLQVQRQSAGKFFKDIACTIPGEWSYVWAGTGVVNDVEHGSWTVFETNLGHLYATPQMIKSRVGIPASDTTNDQELHGACYAASRQIEQYCGRFFWRTLATEARAFETRDLYTVDFGPFNDVVQVASLKTDNDGDGVFETTWSASDYELAPFNNVSGPETQPYTQVKGISRSFPITIYGFNQRTHRVQITGVYGWPSVPAAITEATRVLASELFKLKDAPFGVASFGEYGAIRVQQNPMVALLANPYRHNPGYLV